MRIILAMVVSLDGKSTKADESPNLWASVEDHGFFNDLKKKIGVVIVGRKTYEAAGKPHGDGIRRIVMSRDGPTPREVIADLENRGYKEALLVGGSEINGAFFSSEGGSASGGRRKLINEIYLTIEPKIFGAGLPIAQGILDDVHLELINVRQLNPQGTLLLHYHVK